MYTKALNSAIVYIKNCGLNIIKSIKLVYQNNELKKINNLVNNNERL
jgi:hypothetical protein